MPFLPLFWINATPSLAAAPGSFVETGEPATLALAGPTIVASAGLFAETGLAATLTASRVQPPAGGSGTGGGGGGRAARAVPARPDLAVLLPPAIRRAPNTKAAAFDP